MKYIVFSDPIGIEYMVTFSSMLNHSDVAKAMEGMRQVVLKPVSAGRIRWQEGFSCVGDSVTLKLAARKEDDNLLYASMRAL